MLVKIDIGAMQELLQGILSMRARTLTLRDNINNRLDRIRSLTTTGFVRPVNVGRLDEVIIWTHTQYPIMERRYSLARQIAEATFAGFPKVGTDIPPGVFQVEIDEDLVNMLPDLLDAAQNNRLTDEQWDLLNQIANEQGAAAQGVREWLGSQLYENLSPRQFGAIAAGLGQDFSDSLTADAWTQYQTSGGTDDHATWLAAQEKAYYDRMDALGTLFGAGTLDMNTAEATSAARRYAGFMTDPGNPPDAVVGLSMIFSHGEYNTDFATDLTTRLIDHENSDQFIGWPALSGYTGLGFPSPTGPRTDPMAGIMDMLGNNADAAQRVFTTGETIDLVIGDGENPDQTVTVNANLDYLVNRDWSGIGGPNGSDEGVGLGNALEAATTEQRDPSDPASRTSAAIATDLFAIVGQTQETSQNMDEGLKGSVAIIMADYMPDIGRVAGFRPATGVHDAAPDGIYSGDYGGAFPPGMPPGAVLTRDQVQNIMFGLGMGDNADTNTATVLGGWAAADGMTANHLFSQLGTTDLNWSLYIQSSANLLSFMTESAVGSTHADLEAQAKQAKLINAAISAASSFPAFKAPVAVGQVGAFIWDQARSQSTAAAQAAVSRAMTDTSENTDEYINNLHNKATDAMVEAWVNAYINTGNVSPDDIAAGLAANGDGDRNNDILHIDLYRQYRVHPFGDDYTTWLAHSGIPEDVIRDKINTGLTWTR